MITPTNLTCEYAPNAISIDTQEPRFGWLLQSDRRNQSQSAYQILVAGSAENLQSGRADKWDSGKVASARSVNVPYAGNSLSSDETCYWQLRVWDQDDRASAYTGPAAFTMGLLDESDWTGTWIGAPTDVASPLLRTEFDLAGPVSRARLHISGLGWYELYLNGRRVGDHVLDPATSDYTQRVLYVTHDVTDLLQTGANAVGVMLGNGWYCEPGWGAPLRRLPPPAPAAQRRARRRQHNLCRIRPRLGNRPRPHHPQRPLRRRDLRRPPGTARLGRDRL